MCVYIHAGARARERERQRHSVSECVCVLVCSVSRIVMLFVLSGSVFECARGLASMLVSVVVRKRFW